jgi:hypothetical protein
MVHRVSRFVLHCLHFHPVQVHLHSPIGIKVGVSIFSTALTRPLLSLTASHLPLIPPPPSTILMVAAAHGGASGHLVAAPLERLRHGPRLRRAPRVPLPLTDPATDTKKARNGCAPSSHSWTPGRGRRCAVPRHEFEPEDHSAGSSPRLILP